MNRGITVSTRGKGLHEITADIEAVVKESGIDDGLCTILVQLYRLSNSPTPGFSGQG